MKKHILGLNMYGPKREKRLDICCRIICYVDRCAKLSRGTKILTVEINYNSKASGRKMKQNWTIKVKKPT